MENNEEKSYYQILAETEPKENYTCFDCPIKDTCPVAWDIYNLNGDCLNK